MTRHNGNLAKHDPTILEAMRDKSFDRIQTDAEHYVSQEYATRVYVQEALFAVTTRQKIDEEAFSERDELAVGDPDHVFLLPDELTELRLRAAYHGAGITGRQAEGVPDQVLDRLWTNLANHSIRFDYEQQYSPWSYKFKPGALRAILLYDFEVAARDYASGDLYELSIESEYGELD